MKTLMVLSPDAKVIGFKRGVPIYSTRSIKRVKSSKEKVGYRLAEPKKTTKTRSSSSPNGKRSNLYIFFLNRIRIHNKQSSSSSQVSKEKSYQLWNSFKSSTDKPSQTKIKEFLSTRLNH